MLLATAGHGPAVIDGDSVVTYEELASRSLRTAGTLAELGVQPGDRVAILTRRSADAAAAFYGVLAAGAVAVIVNELLRPRQVEYVLEHSGASALLVERAILDRLPRPLETNANSDRGRRARRLLELRTRPARGRRRGSDRLHLRLDGPAEGGNALARQPPGGNRRGGLLPGPDRRRPHRRPASVQLRLRPEPAQLRRRDRRRPGPRALAGGRAHSQGSARARGLRGRRRAAAVAPAPPGGGLRERAPSGPAQADQQRRAPARRVGEAAAGRSAAGGALPHVRPHRSVPQHIPAA